jgi:hypothetical protein
MHPAHQVNFPILFPGRRRTETLPYLRLHIPFASLVSTSQTQKAAGGSPCSKKVHAQARGTARSTTVSASGNFLTQWRGRKQSSPRASSNSSDGLAIKAVPSSPTAEAEPVLEVELSHRTSPTAHAHKPTPDQPLFRSLDHVRSCDSQRTRQEGSEPPAEDTYQVRMVSQAPPCLFLGL